MTLYTTTFATDFGPFSAATTASGAVVATAFGDLNALRARLPRDPTLRLSPDKKPTARVRAEVLEYAAGRRARFTVAMEPFGTAFQRRVWQALSRIEPGTTRTYAQLAALLRSGPRAIGQANARNPVCLIVPCHRVVGADGTLTGFAFGTALKAALLAHEKRFAARAA